MLFFLYRNCFILYIIRSIALSLLFLLYFMTLDAKELNEDDNEFIRSLTQPQSGEILEVYDKNGSKFVTFSNLDIKVGENGIIIRDLGTYQPIVANVIVVHTEKAKATAKVIPFDQLYQPFLPTPNLIPQVGDRMVFRSFNNKAFIIAPNEENYTAIKEKFSFIEFVSSDLLMGFLNSQGKHDPSIKTLPKACNEYGVGLVFIVGSQYLGVLNCNNLESIIKYKYDPINKRSIKTPFYTRVNFDGGGSLTYVLSSKKSKNYFLYYDNMIDNGGKEQN